MNSFAVEELQGVTLSLSLCPLPLQLLLTNTQVKTYAKLETHFNIIHQDSFIKLTNGKFCKVLLILQLSNNNLNQQFGFYVQYYNMLEERDFKTFRNILEESANVDFVPIVNFK